MQFYTNVTAYNNHNQLGILVEIPCHDEEDHQCQGHMALPRQLQTELNFNKPRECKFLS